MYIVYVTHVICTYPQRDEVQETNIVLASNFIPEPLNYPKTPRLDAHGMSPELSPPKSENQR